MVAVFAVFIVAVAASCINVGKALQKQGTKNLPRLVLDPKVIGTYLSDETWAAGMALDVFGGLLMVAAIARAPVSVVQAVAAGGVAVLAVYSHYKLGETLQAKEWAGVALAVDWDHRHRLEQRGAAARGAFGVQVPHRSIPRRRGGRGAGVLQVARHQRQGHRTGSASTAAARRLSGWSAWDRPTT